MADKKDIYCDEEIVNFLNVTFESKSTVNDMRTLKPDFVQTVYCKILQDFNFPLDKTNQLPYDVNDSVRQYPQAYHSIGKGMVLSGIIRGFLKRIDRDIEFMPGDFFDPKPLRTRRFFSVLIGFYGFAQQYSEKLVDIEEEARFKKEAKDKMMESIEAKMEKSRLLKLENEENQLQVEQMMKRIAEVKVDIQEAQESKSSLKSYIDQLRMTISTNKSEVRAVELEIIKKKELLEILSAQVVLDSERQDIEDRENRLTKFQNDIAERRKNLANLKQVLQTSKSATELIENELMPILQEIQQATANRDELTAAISQKDAAARACIEETEDYSMKIEQLNEILLTKQEKISQMHMAWNLQKDSLKEEIKQLKLTLEEIMRNKTEDEIASQDLGQERLKILRENKQYKEQITQFDIFVSTNYKKILQAMELHNNDVQKGLEQLMTTVKKAE